MTDPTHTNLDQLFNKAKNDEQNLDDFEREALAGFNTLDSKNEAHQLQTALDDRVKKSLFTETKKNNIKVYWLAAAGLALVIGLTTLFVLNNTKFSSNNHNLALTSTKQVTETNPPESGKKLEEPLPPAITSSNDKTPLEVTKAEGKPTTTIGGLLDLNEREREQTSTKLARKIKNPLLASQAANEATQFEQTKSGTKIGDYRAFDDKKTGVEKDQGSDPYRVETKNPTTTYKNSKLDEDRETEINDLSFADNEKSLSKEEAAFQSEPEKKAITLSAPSGVKAKKAQEKSDKNKSHLKDAPGNGESANLIKTADAEGDGSNINASSPAETSSTSSGIAQTEAALINCYYIGGVPVLTKDLKEKLSAENLNKPFDATLYIDEKKRVDTVEFTNTYKLSEKEKKNISKILKSLTQFNFFVSPTKKGNYPYKLSYKPI